VREQVEFTQVGDCKLNNCLMRANADLRFMRSLFVCFISSVGGSRTYRVNAEVGVSQTNLLRPFLVSIVLCCVFYSFFIV
jgi:hypothetical protein